MRMILRDGTPETGSHWTQYNVKPILAVDLHHTITTECSACEGYNVTDFVMGAPQNGCVEALEHLHKTFFILIFTAAGNFWDDKKKAAVVHWLDRHHVPYDDIRFDKPPACFIIDDRAIHHKGWAETMKEIRARLYSPGSSFEVVQDKL